ncbi:hypothetical protein [Chitinophaga arvensicola]|nr:hypothetical protein [Chitinophaga arvensicola]
MEIIIYYAEYERIDMKILLLLSTLLLMICCQHLQTEKNNASKDANADSLLVYLNATLTQFPFLDIASIPDSNELIFYYARQFDTSVLVRLNKHKGVIKGVIYQVAPPYFRNKSKEENVLHFFEGFSFNIDTLQWQYLSRAADSIVNASTGPAQDDGTFDAPDYMISFNSKVRWYTNDAYEALLSRFFISLKTSLLYPQMEKKPQWRRKVPGS